jgi:glycyl-tRNA synthetase
MENIFDINGLIFWTEREIKLRRMMQDYFLDAVCTSLLEMNSAWRFLEVEAPLLTPRNLLNKNYTNEDIWAQEESNLVLRPETTPGSYIYAQWMMNNHSGIKPPFVVWQVGKSFRREQEQPTKHMRLKEFYQQEFQCIYTADTLNDYHAKILEPVRQMIQDIVGLPSRIVESDRLPSYSQTTMDIEVDNGDKWMEVCSISRRTDFPDRARFVTKGKVVERDILVLEIAVGLDRCVYNFLERTQNDKS